MVGGNLKAIASKLLDFQYGLLSERISFSTDFSQYGFPRIALLILLWAGDYNKKIELCDYAYYMESLLHIRFIFH